MVDWCPESSTKIVLQQQLLYKKSNYTNAVPRCWCSINAIELTRNSTGAITFKTFRNWRWDIEMRTSQSCESLPPHVQMFHRKQFPPDTISQGHLHCILGLALPKMTALKKYKWVQPDLSPALARRWKEALRCCRSVRIMLDQQPKIPKIYSIYGIN